MDLSALTALSPVDGRYRKTTLSLARYFSEYGLIRYRVLVEIEYLIFLSEIPLPQLEGKINDYQKNQLRDIYRNFIVSDADEIKQTEKTTNHDVKAVEYFVKDRLKELDLADIGEFVHFGLTSQDVNNTSVPLSLKEGLTEELLPKLNEVNDLLRVKAEEWKNITMLAKTHGQPASPTKLGKEIMVFVERIENQMLLLKTIPFSAKFGGATGNFNAHNVAYPELDWRMLGNEFVNNRLGLTRMQYTTQIEHYDNLAALCDTLKRINNIMIDFCRDVWTYISMDYFKQLLKAGEVGSSAMPHKVNPIDFENAEGNLGVANALFEHFAAKLPISRLQRDLTDSTVLRNIGVPIAHSLIAYTSIIKGANKLLLNKDAIDLDLESNWAVVAEAIQTVLRREGYDKPYEALKALTRTHHKVTKQSLAEFIDTLNVNENVKAELKKITPFNYAGVF
ncbi:adenylosuccinate lyase [Oscillatoria amoena NRMC-F 0135]|nr:adenylosuccinate lyase [Oscillatoria amoena NRMC-F 0135]